MLRQLQLQQIKQLKMNPCLAFADSLYELKCNTCAAKLLNGMNNLPEAHLVQRGVWDYFGGW
jgi:hypothetical protein